MITYLAGASCAHANIQATAGWSGYDSLGKPWQHPLMGGTKTGEPQAPVVATEKKPLAVFEGQVARPAECI